MLLNVIDCILKSQNFFRGIVRNFNVEFFFKRHHQLNGVQAVCTQIVNEAGFRYGFGFIYTEAIRC